MTQKPPLLLLLAPKRSSSSFAALSLLCASATLVLLVHQSRRSAQLQKYLGEEWLALEGKEEELIVNRKKNKKSCTDRGKLFLHFVKLFRLKRNGGKNVERKRN